MPSVEVTSKDLDSKKDERFGVKQQHNREKVGKAAQPVKMPCNPSSASQSPPPTGGELHTNHHGNSIQSNGSTVVEEAKSKMAKEAHPSVGGHLKPDDSKKTSPGKMEGLRVSVDTKPRQAAKTDRPKEFEPNSFALLYMDFKGHHCLEKQRSVSCSYKKETHVLTHTVSAPEMLSSCKESPQEDQVFDDEQTGEKSTGDQSEKVPREGKQVAVETKPQEQLKENSVASKEGTEGRDVEKRDVGKDDSRRERSAKSSSDDKPQANKADAAMKEATEDVSSDAGDGKKEKEKDVEETKKTAGDIDSLTRSLQTNLKLDDGEKAKESKSKGGEVEKLASDRIQSPGRSGLRAKGIEDMGSFMNRSNGNLMSNSNYNGFNNYNVGYHQSQSSQYAVAQLRQTQAQPQLQTNVLPSFNNVFKPGVVNPPGQGNCMPIFRRHPGTVHREQGPAIALSKQGQLAQDALSPLNQSYPLNDLNRSGLSFQTHPQKVPEESTGQPVEVSWPGPLTPESITDMIESMTSDEESVKSPMENEEPMHGGGMMDFLPSPQSPWQTTSAFSPQHSPYAEQTGSIMGSSYSPQHSPYQDPHGSPMQRVPDTSPLTPDSNIGSPGESLPPESPTYSIHSTMGMTASTMTVQDRSSLAPRAPNKQQQQAEEKIHEIKKMLMTVPDPSQSPPQFYPGLPQQGRQFQQPNYQVGPYFHMPPMSPPTAVIPTSFVPQQHTQSQVYPPGVTPLMGELEKFQAVVAGETLADLLETDKDRDTVLHLAICKDKVALSVAIIERLSTEKCSLDLLNKLQQTPLYLAVVCRLPILTEILIMYGASLAIGNMDGNTPLHAAAMMGNTEAIMTIIRCMSLSRCSYPDETSKLFDITNFEGKTALMLAVEAHCESVNCAETIKELLMSNADPLFPDCQSGKTALHYAVELQKMDLIHLLLEECHDASLLVNAKMYNGNTALHLIVGRAIPEAHILYIVGILMSRGANVSISNDANEKPCDLVRREHSQVKHLLHGREHHKR